MKYVTAVLQNKFSESFDKVTCVSFGLSMTGLLDKIRTCFIAQKC